MRRKLYEDAAGVQRYIAVFGKIRLTLHGRTAHVSPYMGQGIEDSEVLDAVRRACKAEYDAEHIGKGGAWSPDNGKAVHYSANRERVCMDPGRDLYGTALKVFVNDRRGFEKPGDDSYASSAIVYWDRVEGRMRMEYSATAWVHLPDCLASFESGTKLAYGDSLPELRAIAERELPLLVAAIEHRVKLAMGDAP
jgi:hypothetical protein